MHLYAHFGGYQDRLETLEWLHGTEDLSTLDSDWIAWELPDSGTYTMTLNAKDKAGNSEEIFANRVVQIIPKLLPDSLHAGTPETGVATSGNIHFQWDSTGVDPLWHTFHVSMAKDSAFTQIVWTGTAPGSVDSLQAEPTINAGIYYWRVCISDRIDSVCSNSQVFYFNGLNLENGGELLGHIKLAGLPQGALGGVVASIVRSGSSNTLYQAVDSNGSFDFTSLQPGNYKLHLIDTLYRGFQAPQDTTFQVVNFLPTQVPEITFLDTANPQTFLESYANGDTIYALADARTLKLSGGFTDFGSGVNPTSVSMILDGNVVSAQASIEEHSWSLAVGSVEDGMHSFQILGQDFSGRLLQHSWTLAVNAKKISLHWINGPSVPVGDTLKLSVQVSNLSPILHQLRWDKDGNGWDDFGNALQDTISFTSTNVWAGALRVEALDINGMARDSLVSFSFAPL